MEFQNKVVMVTGAAGHLGQAVARLFAERGAHVVLLARKMASLERAFSDDLPSRKVSVLYLSYRTEEAYLG